MLIETGHFAGKPTTFPETVRIVTYNVHGPLTEDVEAVCSVLEADEQVRTAHVWAFQEVRTSRTSNFARQVAQRLGRNYAHAIARPRGGGWEGLSILSRLAISDVERLELPHLDTGDRLRIALFVTLSAGAHGIRLCNVHLPIRMDHERRAEQLQLILAKFVENQLPAQVLLGDFNTITSNLRSRYHGILKSAGFRTPFEGNAKTYQRYFFLRFKLDWIYVKELSVLQYGIEQDVKASDHRPVWVDVSLRTASD